MHVFGICFATDIAGCALCTLQWRHHGQIGVPNHQPHDCLLNRLFRRRAKKTSNLRVKSSQVKKFYCNKILNIHGITQRLKPIGFICLIHAWPQLHCNHLIVVTTGLVWVQALRRNGHCSSAIAVSSCTKGYHAENRFSVQPMTAVPTLLRPLRSSEYKRCQTSHCGNTIADTKHKKIYMFTSAYYVSYNTLSTEENGGHFADDIYTSFSPVNACIQIYSAIVHYSPIQSTLVKAMAWCRIGDKLLSKPMLTQLTDALMRWWGTLN